MVPPTRNDNDWVSQAGLSAGAGQVDAGMAGRCRLDVQPWSRLRRGFDQYLGFM
jgi:hypothetical protein